MDRLDFLKKAGRIAAGTLAASVAAPYILPSGRLFASSGGGMADHVVFVLFAGGVRVQETVQQLYLDQSQGVAIQGNIMPNLLTGQQPNQKIVYGIDGALPGDTPIPAILSTSLQEQGVLFEQVISRQAGHYAGLNGLVTGNYDYSQGLRSKSRLPTVFEYVRRHLGLPASKVWFIGNGISNSVPLLNYSSHDSYGLNYGANFLAPNITFGGSGIQHLSNAKVYHPEEELDPMYRMKLFLDQTSLIEGKDVPGIKNTDEEKLQIKEFIRGIFQKDQSGQTANAPIKDNGDLRTMGYACEVLKEFTPTLTVINLNNIDVGHSNFTGYLKGIHRADHGVGHIWDYIQTQIPAMAGRTALVLVPECGRNLAANPILDVNDWGAYDHSGSDDNTHKVFGMMAGPGIPSNLKISALAANTDSSMHPQVLDGVLTVGEILGIKNDISGAGFMHSFARSWFDRI